MLIRFGGALVKQSYELQSGTTNVKTTWYTYYAFPGARFPSSDRLGWIDGDGEWGFHYELRRVAIDQRTEVTTRRSPTIRGWA